MTTWARKRRKQQAVSRSEDINNISNDHVATRTNVRALEDRRTFHPQRINRLRPLASVMHHHAVLKVAEKVRNHAIRALKSSVIRSVPRRARLRLQRKDIRSAPLQMVRGVPLRLRVSSPNNVALCVRRKERKEVLFALKLRGKGSGSRRRRNEWSNIGC